MATALRLQTREARRKLAHSDDPYWYELRRGLHIGYRRGTTGGSWLLREYRGGKYTKRRLAAADDDAPSDGTCVLSWAEAQAAALGTDRPTLTVPGRLTVADAWTDYCQTRQTPPDARDKSIWDEFIAPAFGTKVVSDLTTRQLEKWLADQVGEYGQRRKSTETDARELRRKSQATANRRWNLLRAILNSAYRKDPERVPSDDAWGRVQPYQRVDRPRLRTVNAAEARRLTNALPPPVRALALGALHTGCRLGELQAITASDIGAGEIRIRHSKSGRSRVQPLTAEGEAFFEQQAAGKTGTIFEPAVHRVAIARAMRAASAVAKLAPPVTLHDLRRSYASLLINAGVPMESISKLLGHADLRMTTRVYAHLQQETLRKAVSKLPDFGTEKTNVVPMKRRGKRA